MKFKQNPKVFRNCVLKYVTSIHELHEIRSFLKATNSLDNQNIFHPL
jgi:hypothetical protein